MKALRRSHTTSARALPSNESSNSPTSSSSSWIHLRSLVVVVAAASSPAYDRGSLKSPWSRTKRKSSLSHNKWRSLFTPEGKLRDGGRKFLKKVRSGGIDPAIRAEVWPFLLGVYDLSSTEAERHAIRRQKRKEYERLRRQCRRILKNSDKDLKGIDQVIYDKSPESPESPESEYLFSSRFSVIEEETSSNFHVVNSFNPGPSIEEEEEEESVMTHIDASQVYSESSGSDLTSEEETESMLMPNVEGEGLRMKAPEDFSTWQRIIRLDAIRANIDWFVHSPTQAAVSEEKAIELAVSVGLKDYDHLEAYGIRHAARLVAVLEAYALYDPEIGYCQGMSDLLSPIIAVMEEDDEAFWCFVGFMRKARHNFRLDEMGIRRQLNIVSKIIKSKDSHLYRHLEKLQAEDCFFVYRMVVVLFRRELDFEQTLCLWEVMWADQAAIRAGIGKSAWGRIRLRAPPTDDLLLYAIAACVLQRRKLIIESYRSMDEIIRECNNMAGNLDVWKLLDDAHDLVVSLHAKI